MNSFHHLCWYSGTSLPSQLFIMNAWSSRTLRVAQLPHENPHTRFRPLKLFLRWHLYRLPAGKQNEKTKSWSACHHHETLKQFFKLLFHESETSSGFGRETKTEAKTKQHGRSLFKLKKVTTRCKCWRATLLIVDFHFFPNCLYI